MCDGSAYAFFKIRYLDVRQLTITTNKISVMNPKKAAGSHGDHLNGRHRTVPSGLRANEIHKPVVYYLCWIARQLACERNVNLFCTSRFERSWLRLIWLGGDMGAQGCQFDVKRSGLLLVASTKGVPDPRGSCRVRAMANLQRHKAFMLNC